MKSDPSPQAVDLPVYGDEPDASYSIEVIAELAGVDTRTILHYQEKGFIRPVAPESGEPALFDAECLRQLRRIEHLRATCGMNDAGLKLILDLLHEVECLRQERRQRTR
jgi:MerR family transcriptional regulator/heat shock protein HspR